MTTRETELLAANAALELEVASLRSVMADVIKAHGYAGGTPIEVMSTPFTLTALNELIEKVEKRTIERCAAEIAEAVDMVGIIGYSDRECLQVAIRALPTGQIKLEELV